MLGIIYQDSAGSGMVNSYNWTVPATFNGYTINGTDYQILVAAWDASPNHNESAAVSSGYITLQPADTTGPAVTISYPQNNATVTSASLTVTGTASDSGLGNDGVSSVTVNGVSASGGTASGANTANWSAPITLSPGRTRLRWWPRTR